MTRRSHAGFTMVELLTVITVIAVLASIAMPKYQLTRQKALSATMVADLKNLVSAQEGFLSNHGRYATGITAGPDVPSASGGLVSFQTSPGNEITIMGAMTVPGWGATAKNPGVNLPSMDVCGVYVGHKARAPNVAVVTEGAPVCY